MPCFTRRVMLGAAAATALSTTLPAAEVLASAPSARRQVPGIYRYRVGTFELTSINDGVNQMQVKEGYIKNVDLTEVRSAIETAYLSPDKFGIPFTQLIVNTGRRVVLIDTGTGGQLAPTAGMLIENMEAAGIDPKAVDTVIISHFHGDHILGLRTKAGKLAFPNAEVMVPEPEWAFWMDEGEMSRAPEARQGAFRTVHKIFDPIAKDVKHYQAEQELVPGIIAHAAYGHTPGHMIFRVADGDDQMLVLSDTTNHPALFVRNPGWHGSFDIDPIMAEATRRRVLDMASAERIRVQGYHFPFPATGHIAKKNSDRYDYIPGVWNPIL